MTSRLIGPRLLLAALSLLLLLPAAAVAQQPLDAPPAAQVVATPGAAASPVLVTPPPAPVPGDEVQQLFGLPEVLLVITVITIALAAGAALLVRRSRR